MVVGEQRIVTLITAFLSQVSRLLKTHIIDTSSEVEFLGEIIVSANPYEIGSPIQPQN